MDKQRGKNAIFSKVKAEIVINKYAVEVRIASSLFLENSPHLPISYSFFYAFCFAFFHFFSHFSIDLLHLCLLSNSSPFHSPSLSVHSFRANPV